MLSEAKHPYSDPDTWSGIGMLPFAPNEQDANKGLKAVPE
jgi:hypothetical protein